MSEPVLDRFLEVARSQEPWAFDQLPSACFGEFADEERSQSILQRIPAGRWGTPDDLKGAVVFLASEAARYVHGAIVPVDGGWLTR